LTIILLESLGSFYCSYFRCTRAKLLHVTGLLFIGIFSATVTS